MESLDTDLISMEKRIRGEFTKKLSNTVDKLAIVIEK